MFTNPKIYIVNYLVCLLELTATKMRHLVICRNAATKDDTLDLRINVNLSGAVFPPTAGDVRHQMQYDYIQTKYKLPI